MDINNRLASPTLTTPATSQLATDWQLNQLLYAQLANEVSPFEVMTLNIADSSLTVRCEPPLHLSPGQALQLQVVKLSPVLEFKLVTPVLDALPELSSNPPLSPVAGEFMDTNLRLPSSLIANLSTVNINGQPLKLNQLLDAKVTETQLLLDTLSLKIGDKTLSVSAQPPLSLQAGQSLQLQVIKLLPTPEFKVLAAPINLGNPLPSSNNLQTSVLKLLTPVSNPTATANNPLSQLMRGQSLTATVLNISNNQVSLQLNLPLPTSGNTNSTTTQLLVTVDAKQLLSLTPDTPNSSGKTASTSALPSLKPGMVIDLQVAKAGETPVFAVSQPTVNPQQQIVEAFKQLLPIQSSPASLLNQLPSLLPALMQNPSVAETLKHLAQEILQSIPLKTQLTEPGLLKQAVADSGLFLEAKLAELLAGKTDIALQPDLKLKLSKLALLLNQAVNHQVEPAVDDQALLKDSLQKTQGALAKLTLDQLHSLPKEDSNKQSWILELPFFHNQAANTVQIEIEQDQAREHEQTQKNWAVSITITPPELATIHCKISCYDGAINTRFWSEAADTVERINSNLDYLKQQFELKGLTSGFMEAHQGKSQSNDNIKKPLTHLLNEQA